MKSRITINEINGLFLQTALIFLFGVYGIAVLKIYLPISDNLQMALGQVLTVLPSCWFLMKKAGFYTREGRKAGMEFLKINRFKPSDMGIGVLTGVFMIPIVLFISMISMIFFTNFVDGTAETMKENSFLISAVFYAVIPALVEEFLFRGVFFQFCRRYGIVKSVLISSLFFGCLHMNFNQFFYAFVTGIFLALLVELTDSLWSGAAAHLTINMYTVIMVYAGYADMQLSFLLAGVLAGICFCLLCVLWYITLNRKSKKMVENNSWKTAKKKNGNETDGIITGSLIAALVICFMFMVWSEISFFISA